MRVVDQAPAAVPRQPPRSPVNGDADASRTAQTDNGASVVPTREECLARVTSNVDGFERRGQAWFVATELQSDLVVDVGDMSFNLHKFPLLSRSGKLNRLMFDSRDTENSHIKLEEMPGGPETFELAAQFCYGQAVELTAANVAALRCAAEYLEMTEDLDEGNLRAKTEDFIGGAVLASWSSSVEVLQSCEALLPWAEDLQIVRRCCESVAWKASHHPRSIRWSFSELSKLSSSSKPEPKSRAFHASPLRNGSHAQTPPPQRASDPPVPGDDWWIEDICVVGVQFFRRIIDAIKVKGMRYDLIGAAVMQYAERWLPDLAAEIADLGIGGAEGDVRGKGSSSAGGSALAHGDEHGRVYGMDEAQRRRHREVIEDLWAVIPAEEDAVDAAFVFRLLRWAKVARVDDAVAGELERRAGQQLDQAAVPDLLIPKVGLTSSNGSAGGGEIAFDVDLVRRMVDCFLELQQEGLHRDAVDAVPPQYSEEVEAKIVLVTKRVDGYLAEVGGDQRVTVDEFVALAEAVPESARSSDNGLYRAVDTYLKAHPWLSEHDRKQLCRTLDCQRLSFDACMHAAQNERLPLRVVVQVLFGEQIKLRNAISGTNFFAKEPSGSKSHHRRPSTAAAAAAAADDQTSVAGGGSCSPRSVSVGALREGDDGHYPVVPSKHSEEDIRDVRSDVERMKVKFMELQNEYAAVQLQLEQLSSNCNCGGNQHQSKPKSKSSPGWKKLIPQFGPRPMISPHELRQQQQQQRQEPLHQDQDISQKYPEQGHHRDDATTQNPHHPSHGKAQNSKDDHIDSSNHQQQQQQQQPAPPPTSHRRKGDDDDQRPHQKDRSLDNDPSQRQATPQQHQGTSHGAARRPPRDTAGYSLDIPKSSMQFRHSNESRVAPETRSSHHKPKIGGSGPVAAAAAARPAPAFQAYTGDGDSIRSVDAPGTPSRTGEQRKKLVGIASVIRKWRNSIS